MRGWMLGLVLCFTCFPAAAGAEGPAPAAAPAGRYELDHHHAHLTARLHVGFWRYNMRFDSLAGRFDYDPANWRATRVLISVDPRSLRAQQRDWTLASFEPDKYPVIRYASTQVLPISAGRGRLAGDLTLHGVTRPVTLDFVFSDLGTANDLGAARMAFSGSGRIRRSDFGLAKSSHFAGDEVDLLFEVEFLQATARARAQFAEGRAAKP